MQESDLKPNHFCIFTDAFSGVFGGILLVIGSLVAGTAAAMFIFMPKHPYLFLGVLTACSQIWGLLYFAAFIYICQYVILRDAPRLPSAFAITVMHTTFLLASMHLDAKGFPCPPSWSALVIVYSAYAVLFFAWWWYKRRMLAEAAAQNAEPPQEGDSGGGGEDGGTEARETAPGGEPDGA